MRTVLPHLVWLVIAAAAFAFGKFQGSAGSKAGDSAGSGAGALASKTVRPGEGSASRGKVVDGRSGGLSIGGETLRNETVSRTVREWMRRDPAAAGQWVEGADLPESVVTDIKQPRDDRRWRR